MVIKVEKFQTQEGVSEWTTESSEYISMGIYQESETINENGFIQTERMVYFVKGLTEDRERVERQIEQTVRLINKGDKILIKRFSSAPFDEWNIPDINPTTGEEIIINGQPRYSKVFLVNAIKESEHREFIKNQEEIINQSLVKIM